jgi:hypothetical protein
LRVQGSGCRFFLKKMFLAKNRKIWDKLANANPGTGGLADVPAKLSIALSQLQALGFNVEGLGTALCPSRLAATSNFNLFLNRGV